MRHRLPVVGPLERALFLRSLALFRDLPATDLVPLAQLMREQWVRRGSVLYSPGRRVRVIHFLVEGRMRYERDGRPVRRAQAPDAVGLIEILADEETSMHAIADSNMLTLVIDSEAFLDVMDDRFSIFLHLRNALGRQMLDQQRPADWGILPPATPPEIGRFRDASLDVVERLIWLQCSPVLKGLGVSVLAALARDELEIRLRPGEPLWETGAEARFFALIAHGTIACTPDSSGTSIRVGAGTVIGMEAAFAGIPHAYTAVAETAAVAIRIDVQDLLDVAEDHAHVVTRILAFNAQLLRQLQERNAGSAANAPTAAIETTQGMERP